jgi:hypothetical protein
MVFELILHQIATLVCYNKLMAKKTTKTENPRATNAVDILSVIVSFFFMQSVLTVAHHTSMWIHDGSSRIVEAPALPVLALALVLCAYSVYKTKGKPTVLTVISLTIQASASLFWLSGLRTNFFY